jgi:hypothetical protein
MRAETAPRPLHTLLPGIAQERLRAAAAMHPFLPSEYVDDPGRRAAVDRAIADIRKQYPHRFRLITEE